eukprot:scaffold17117_cov52-Attheya_sp.AAC.9
MEKILNQASTLNGDARAPYESATTEPPRHAVPAPQQELIPGVPRSKRTKKRLRDFLRKNVFYSQNIQQGSGKNKKEKTGSFKFDYIITLMKKKGIDIYLVQETWIPNDFDSEIKGHYIFHHGTPEASDSNTGEAAEERRKPERTYERRSSHHSITVGYSSMKKSWTT